MEKKKSEKTIDFNNDKMIEGLNIYKSYCEKVRKENPNIKRKELNDLWNEYKIKIGRSKPKVNKEKKVYKLDRDILYVCKSCGETFYPRDIKVSKKNKKKEDESDHEESLDKNSYESD